MLSLDHVPYLVAFLAALYIAQSFVLSLVRELRGARPAEALPFSSAPNQIIEIVATTMRSRGLDKHVNEVLEPLRAAHHELRNALTSVAQAVEPLQRDMSTCKTNITDIAASLNQIAPLIQSLKSSVAPAAVAEKDVHSFSDTRRTPFFRRKSSEDNALRDSPPTAKVTDSPTKSAAEKASELADAMMADVRKATDVELPPLPPPSAERHNRDLIG